MATITQWKILKTLSRKVQGTQEIRDKLARDGVTLTLRSIQRNLDTLSEIFSITSDHKNPAGWKWAADCDLLDLPVMDTSAALTLRMAEEHLTPMLPKSCLSTLHPYMKRARNLLDEVGDKGVGEWARRVGRISRTHHLMTPEIDAEVLDAVYQGVLEQRQLSVQYRALGDGAPKERIIHPLGLAFAEGVIYLVGTAWDYGDIRQFALHRMASATLLDAPARLNASFDLASYVAEGHFDIPVAGEAIRLHLRADRWLACYLEECRLSSDQTIRDEGESFSIEATVQRTLQLQWWLLGLGTHVEVLAPMSLRSAMQETVRALHGVYGDAS
jgi:predicted DNA-binding transcriptional regulator YafY